MVLTRTLPIRSLYENIEWPIIILLAAMIPIGHALQTTGGTTLITDGLLKIATQLSPTWILAIVFIVTMTLSDFMNNAATTVVMAPIAISIARALGVHIDPFLMAVAIGASCSFLTPIGHQNNTLVMGPGGYRFSDYIRLGLPLEILITIAAIPLILWAWPLH
jgi:di/tricarboxylate transporter